MKKNILYTTLCLVLLSLIGCNDYLDQLPDNRTQFNNLETIKELLVDAYPTASYVPFCETMGDGVGDKGTSLYAGRMYRQMYYWEKVDEIDTDTPTNYWNVCYAGIATANQALKSLDDLKGVAEEDINAVKGEALLCRAYAHFMLANLFCKPYDPAILEKSLGIPYVKTVETVLLKKYKRGTLKETYDNIRNDLEEGLKLIGNEYIVPQYHFTTTSASAFASRFYLTIGEWENVVKYADVALGNMPETKLRDWSPNSFLKTAGYFEIKNRYSSTEEKANLLLASVGSVYPRTWLSRYSLTTQKQQEILGLGNNALGIKLLYRLFGDETSTNIPKVKEYFKKSSLNGETGWVYQMITLFSGDEVLLNRAEAYAMLNKKEAFASDMALFYSKKSNYTASSIKSFIMNKQPIEKFYTNNTVGYNPFYQISPAVLPLVKFVRDARRAEFVFEGMNWFDVRRFHLAVKHNLVMQDGSESEIELLADDARKVLQIPEEAISHGLEPNVK